MASAQITVPNRTRRTRRKSKMLPMTFAVIGAIAAWWGWNKTHPPVDPNAAQMITATVTRGDLTETITATGSITAQTGAQVKIGSQITGRIKKLNADVGSYVEKGSVIAELDLPDIKAQYDQALANRDAARTKLAQQRTGLPLQQSQTGNAVTQAQADVARAQARLQSAKAAASLQNAQTPTTIARAQSDVARYQAALSTAISSKAQVDADANLQIAQAREELTQAKANATNSAANLKRQQGLLASGFVAQSVVDAAVAQDAVYQSQVASSTQNIGLVQQKIAADKQSAADAVTQAQQNLAASQQALVAARAGKYTDTSRLADVNDARAQLQQAYAALKAALANRPQDTIKQQDIQQAQEAVAAAQAQVDYQAAQYDKTFIRTPISGTVLQLAAQQGETLAAGLSAPTLIIVADLKRLQVDVFVDETDIGKVRKGQTASVKVDAFGKRPFNGKVMKIASGSTIQQGVVTYDVTVDIEDPKHQLKPDMTANVTIQTGTRSGVLLVPSESIKVSTKGSTVNLLVKKDGKASYDPHPVKTGASDGVNTEVREGLNEGDVIVVAGGQDPKKPGPGGGGSPFGGGGGGRGR